MLLLTLPPVLLRSPVCIVTQLARVAAPCCLLSRLLLLYYQLVYFIQQKVNGAIGLSCYLIVPV